MHACTHAHMHTCTHAHMHTCTHAHMHTCTHAHMHTCIHAYMHTCIHAYMFTSIHPSIHTCMHACMPVSYMIYIWQRFEILPHAHINDFFEHDWLNICHTTSHQVSAQRKAELLQLLPPRLTSPEPLGIYGSPKWGCHVLMSTYFNLWKRGHHQISDIIDIYWMI